MFYFLLCFLFLFTPYFPAISERISLNTTFFLSFSHSLVLFIKDHARLSSSSIIFLLLIFVGIFSYFLALS